MSTEPENIIGARRLPFAFILAGILVLGAFAMTTASPSAQTGLPIVFDKAQPQSTGASSGLTSLSLACCFNVTAGETVIVVVGDTSPSGSGTTPISTGVTCNVQGSNLIFTQQLVATTTKTHFSLWTAKSPVAGPLTGGTGSTALKVAWNESAVGGFEVATYLNANSIGAKQTNTGTATSGSFTVTTTVSGSWIIGGTVTGTTVTAADPQPNGSGLVQRAHQHNSPKPGIAASDLEDSNNQFVNNYPFLYSSQWTAQGSQNFAQGAVELTPVLGEPTDQTGECTFSNNICPTRIHVHHPNTMNFYLPNFTPDPFTTTSTTPVILTNLSANINPYNGTNAEWLLVLVEVTFRVSPAGTAYAYIFLDGNFLGVETETTSVTFVTQSMFIAFNNTITGAGVSHAIDVRVASSNVLDTVSVRGAGTDAANGNFETYMSIMDLTSAPPT